MPIDLALDLTAQGLHGLCFAHDLGIVHRDVKLRNLFVCKDDQQIKVMDFGIATLSGGGTGLTRTGMVVGTPAFVAPERLKNNPSPPTAAVDIYAMGVVLYRMLTGVLPFDRRSVSALFNDILSREPRPPSSFNPSIPPDLDAIVMRMLAKDPMQRFPTADSAREALLRAKRNFDRFGA